LETEKQKFLRHLIDYYDEGRSRSFYCTGCQLLPVDKLRETLEDAKVKMTQDADIKTKARIVRAVISTLADTLQISLKLRK